MGLTRRQIQEKHPQEGSNGASSPVPTVHQHHHVPPKTLQHQALEVAEHIKHEMVVTGKTPISTTPTTPPWVFVLLVIFAAISVFAIPKPFQPQHGQEPTIRHVFYYGWLTAISTGLGALPFLLVPNVKSFWVGVSNGMSLVFPSQS